MYIQRSRSANPYAAYQTLLQQRGLFGERGMALREPELKVAELTAPVLKAQLLAHANRFERLGGLLGNVTPLLGQLADPAMAPAVRVTARVAAAKPSDGGEGQRTAATPASMVGDVAIALNQEATGSTATMMSEAPSLRLDTGTPATAASMMLGQVRLNDTQMTKAVLRGDNLNLRLRGTGADFGSLTINGVTTTLGVFEGTDERQAAQFIVDRLNANEANTVTATIDKDLKRITLTSKIPGSAGDIVIDQASSDSDGIKNNDTSTGFQTGDRADGKDGGLTDFGSVTVNGVTTTFGTLDNRGQTAQTATQWLVDRLNANAANDFTAQVGGDARDQIVLTSRQSGGQSLLRIDQVTADTDGNQANAGTNGFVAGMSAQGRAADAGVTDLGSLTLNGVTTTFGTVSNAGLTLQGAARFMVDRLNANGSNPVVASLGGDNLDRVVLTAKTPGSAGSFRIDGVGSDTDAAANDGFNGWVAGREATGQDAVSGATDFGSITINGITTQFGVLDGQQTSRSALQFLLGRLNETNSTVTAREEDGRILLSSKDTGPDATLRIDAVSSDSDGQAENNRGIGFAFGRTAKGKAEEEVPGGAAAGPVSVTYERTVENAHVSRVLGMTTQVLEGINKYLAELKNDKPTPLRGVQGFHAELMRTLDQERETLSGLGIQLKKDGLEVDEAALDEAVRRDPQEAAGLFKRLNQALEAPMGAQAFALNEMRSAVQSTSENAASISQVAASIFKIDHRAKKVSWLMDEMKLAEERMREQQERLEKAAETSGADKEDEEDEKSSGKASAADPQKDQEPSAFGLFKSPLPESYLKRLEAIPESAPRWPFER